jgi:DNA mismatch repair protein PMS2
MPVRRKELERNIKREWNKVISLLNQYACIQTGLKFTVSQQPNKGKRIVLFATKGNLTTRDNIINIFGAKTLTALLVLDLTLEFEPSNAILRAGNSGDDANNTTVRVLGHVSRPVHGEGRQTPDRQMFFVNSRPCMLPQFAKVFNEVYKSYNSSQSPFILADIRLDTRLYDVNVSPDKRTILLHDQGRMLEKLRESLLELFESQHHTVPVSQLLIKTDALFKKPKPVQNKTAPPESPVEESSTNNLDVENKFPVQGTLKTRGVPEPSQEKQKEMPSGIVSARGLYTGRSVIKNSATSSEEQLISTSAADGNLSVDESNSRRFAPPHGDIENPLAISINETPGADIKGQQSSAFHTAVQEIGFRVETRTSTDQPVVVSQMLPVKSLTSSNSERHSTSPSPPVQSELTTSPHETSDEETINIKIGDRTINNSIGRPHKKQKFEARTRKTHSTRLTKAIRSKGPVPSFDGRLTRLFMAQSSPSLGNIEDDQSEKTDGESGEDAMEVDDSISDAANESSDSHAPSSANEQPDSVATGVGNEHISEARQLRTPSSDTAQSCPKRLLNRKTTTTLRYLQQLKCNESYIEQCITNWLVNSRSNGGPVSTPLCTDSMGIEATNAEAALSLIISKTDFEKMIVIGQFNLGFILAVRPAESIAVNSQAVVDDHLFIIDQHASDEKYNFETLQATTILQSQTLAHPKRLELTALDEEIVMENLPALKANGFRVDLELSGDTPVGSRCRLLALPQSRETTFDLSDFEELISLLGDTASTESGVIPRPSKVRRMLAMRACRSSVMIGKALQQTQMERLIKHMGELDKPWNCPHGRPTMRHLCGLNPWDQTGWSGDTGDGEGSLSSSIWASFAAL